MHGEALLDWPAPPTCPEQGLPSRQGGICSRLADHRGGLPALACSCPTWPFSSFSSKWFPIGSKWFGPPTPTPPSHLTPPPKAPHTTTTTHPPLLQTPTWSLSCMPCGSAAISCPTRSTTSQVGRSPRAHAWGGRCSPCGRAEGSYCRRPLMRPTHGRALPAVTG